MAEVTTTSDPPPITEKRKSRNKYATGCAALASMTSILLGYDIGVMSGAALFIQEDLKCTDVQIEILAGIINVYSLLGSTAAGKTSDLIGRRYTVVVAAILFFAGSLLMGFATNYAFLMIGRFVAGIGLGFGFMIGPVYTAEVAPTATRGLLTTFPEVLFNIGLLIGYALNYAFALLPLNLGWRLMLGIAAVPSVMLGVGVLLLPESPRWLVMKGRLGEAKAVLHKISGSQTEAQLRLADIKAAAGIPESETDDVVVIPKRKKSEAVWRELFLRPRPAVRHILVAAIGIHFFQQASGIDSVVLYSPRIFEKAGIVKSTDKLLVTIAVGFSKLLFTLVAAFLLDKVGRRPLLLTSIGGMSVSLLALATSLVYIDRADHKLMWAVGLAVASVLSFVGFFSVGMGPITWVYSSEILPLKLRAQGLGLSVAVNRLTSGLISMSFITLYKAITISGAFFLYAGIEVVAWFFFFTLLPETYGRNLEDTEALFGGWFRWRTTLKDLEKKERQDSTDQVSADRV